MPKNIIYPFLVLCLANCGAANEKIVPVANAVSSEQTQSLELIIDGKKTITDQEDIITLNYVNEQKSFGLSLLSEKKDLQLAITANLADLKIGSYEVYDCKGPSNCDQAMDDKNQDITFGPFPKDPMPATTLFRKSYNAASLGLKPLTLTIISITDEQQNGIPWKTKRVKGEFSGTLAYVEQVGYDWKVVGNTTNLQGKFDMYCGMR